MIVAAYQVGRVFDGGACAIGFATSTNNGATWTTGLLPGITRWTASQGVANGPYDQATDASVAYDAKDNLWMVSTLGLTQTGGVKGVAVLTSISADGGFTWSNPVAAEHALLLLVATRSKAVQDVAPILRVCVLSRMRKGS